MAITGNEDASGVVIAIARTIHTWPYVRVQGTLSDLLEVSEGLETYRTMPIPTERDRCSNHTAQIENGPENANELSLILLSGIS